ncbi:uncharacterized protein LOC126665263 [Mercurialis annua]|uniref:uncharacterized protein LOC126665263 n=1 Tax=Mercurialis annua TaxID=3986 RepID=UPI00215E4952|nr:uncharacterized protein LOC126665263 [Mercurialis annua]
MEDQRPFSFSRFRLPWVTAAPRPPVEPQTPRPTIPIQAPAQPTAIITQRPFRPGLPSVQIDEPVQPLAASTSQVTGQPTPLSTTQTQAAPVPSLSSQTLSPSRAESEPAQSLATNASRVTGQPATLSTIQPQAASVPPFSSQTLSPSRARSENRAASRTRSPSRAPKVSPPSSPPNILQSTTQKISQPRSEPGGKGKENKERKDVEDKLKKEANTNNPAEDEPLRSAIAELLTGSQGRELHSVTFDSEQKLHDKDDKKKHIKTASSTHPKARNQSTESQQKPSMSSGGKVPLHQEIRDDISKFIHKLGMGKLKHPMDEKPVSIVTIAGENTGASMCVGAEPPQKDGSIHIHRGYKLNPDDSGGTTTDGEGSGKETRSNNPIEEDPESKAYVNSNIQSINNSIVFDSSMTHQNPGVHLAFSDNLEEQDKPVDKPDPVETHKAEVSITPAQKLTYDPTIRRRCLRGLFLESSDSSDDNSDKPRRHGCRYVCRERAETDIGVP